MDPNETLVKMRDAARAIEIINGNPDGCAAEDIAYHALDLAPAVIALDEHLRQGGALPAAWQQLAPAVGTGIEAAPPKPGDLRAGESTLEGWSRLILYGQPAPAVGTAMEKKR